MNKLIVAAAVMAGGLGAPAMAQSHYGAQALLAGRDDLARTIIQARLAAEPNEPSALLNAALLAQRSGRHAESRAFYAQVLGGENVALDVADGRTMMSHDIARRGLALSQVASR
ncbi:Tfp pilus assembly protein PilF [Sphingomonas jejuensis]|uniref:Tfp pilus assembly protein PilF n=1 Tax=Sphingomonas jejuensis TaxID=904715 RepID=A0ABX0XIB0_9SPHN|nr:tetratricopeptide repeat protein [Sphingomonas jejuensis]NJC33071.1 Tfp pilus assembly protein PilF [Sphingomonas jejuensis]